MWCGGDGDGGVDGAADAGGGRCVCGGWIGGVGGGGGGRTEGLEAFCERLACRV
jgi:hypothetical protein